MAADASAHSHFFGVMDSTARSHPATQRRLAAKPMRTMWRWRLRLS